MHDFLHQKDGLYVSEKVFGNVVVAGGAVEEQVPLGGRWQWPQKYEACAGSAHSL